MRRLLPPAAAGHSAPITPRPGNFPASKFRNEPPFDPLARPRCFAQERETGFHRRVELKAADGDASSHFAPAMPQDKLIENVLQRDAVQGIAGM